MTGVTRWLALRDDWHSQDGANSSTTSQQAPLDYRKHQTVFFSFFHKFKKKTPTLKHLHPTLNSSGKKSFVVGLFFHMHAWKKIHWQDKTDMKQESCVAAVTSVSWLVDWLLSHVLSHNSDWLILDFSTEAKPSSSHSANWISRNIKNDMPSNPEGGSPGLKISFQLSS